MYMKAISIFGDTFMNIVNIRNNMADALNRVADQGERIVLERQGKPVAVACSRLVG